MAIITYPLNGIEYTAENAETYLCTRTSGVYSADTHYKASVTGNRQVTISPGLAWIQNTEFTGKSVFNDSNVVIDIPVADGALPRIDRIVLRFDKAANSSSIALKQGVASLQPKAPDVSRTEVMYELGLCTVSVPASSVYVQPGDVTSTLLDEAVCGLMRDGVTGLPSQQMFNEFTSRTQDAVTKANQNFNSAKTKFESDSSQLLTEKGNAFDSSISSFEDEADELLQTKEQALDQAKTDFETESGEMLSQASTDLSNSKNEYDTWFAKLKEELGEGALKVGAVPLTRTVNGLYLDKDIEVPISQDYDITIPHTGWSLDNSSGFQTIEIECRGIYDTDRPVVDVALTGNKTDDEEILNEWSLISMVKSELDKIKIFASDVPLRDINAHIKVVY